MTTLLNTTTENNIINLFPFSSIKEHLTQGTIKDANDNPLVRNISSYRNNIEDSKNELLLYKNTTSDSNGNFELELNDNVIPFTIIIHGADGENDVIFKDVLVT